MPLVFSFTLALVISALSTTTADQNHSFHIDQDAFWRDGVNTDILAGGLHYFRVPSAYWRDRLQLIKAMGLNAVDTYVPWNLVPVH